MEVSVGEIPQGDLVRCYVVEAGGDVVLWGEYFIFLCFCLFGWELFFWGGGVEIEGVS